MTFPAQQNGRTLKETLGEGFAQPGAGVVPDSTGVSPSQFRPSLLPSHAFVPGRCSRATPGWINACLKLPSRGARKGRGSEGGDEAEHTRSLEGFVLGETRLQHKQPRRMGISDLNGPKRGSGMTNTRLGEPENTVFINSRRLVGGERGKLRAGISPSRGFRVQSWEIFGCWNRNRSESWDLPADLQAAGAAGRGSSGPGTRSGRTRSRCPISRESFPHIPWHVQLLQDQPGRVRRGFLPPRFVVAKRGDKKRDGISVSSPARLNPG